MQQDSLTYDSLNNRPLPKWLTDQRDGLNTYQPEVRTIKEDHSLQVSIGLTGAVILLAIIFLTIRWYMIRRKKSL